MSNPKRNPIVKQPSLSSIEQSLKIIPAPPQEPVTIYVGPKSSDSKLSKADIEIANRLQKLRRRDVDIPTEEEMAERLAQIKGLPKEHYQTQAAPFYRPPDNRTDAQKSEDLINQALNEVSLDSKVARRDTNDIESRLARLRGVADPHSPSQDSEMQTETALNVSSHLHIPSIPPGPDAMDVDEPTQIISPSQRITSRSVNARQAQSTVGTAPGGYNHPISNTIAPLDILHHAIEKLLKEAQAETSVAAEALHSLKADPELKAALKMSGSRKTRQKKKEGRGTSSDEKFSADSDDGMDDEPSSGKTHSQGASKDEAEVERIVKMYTAKAERKKLRKKKKLAMAKKSSDSDSSSSLDSISDLEVSTPESEKFSSSDSD